MSTTSVRPPVADVMARQTVRDPDFPLLVVALLVAVYAGMQVLAFPLGRSQSAYALSGQILAQGGALGKDVWLVQGPGISIYHQLVQRLLGGSALTLRLLEVFWLGAWVYLSIRLSRRFLGLDRVGLIGGALAVLVYAQLEYEHTGQPELFATLAMGAGLVLMVKPRPSRQDWPRFCGVGLWVGLATLFVPYFALAILPIAYWIFKERGEHTESVGPKLKVLGGLVLGMLLPWGLLWVELGLRGAAGVYWRDWVVPQAALSLHQPYDVWLQRLYYTTVRVLLRLSALIPVGCLLFFILTPLSEEEKPGTRLLLGVVLALHVGLTCFSDSTLSRLSGLFPIWAFLAGAGIYKAWRKALGLGPVAVLGFAGAAFILGWMWTPVQVGTGTFWWRSLARLGYLSHLGPYRSLELFEGDLYQTRDFSMFTTRRVAAQLRCADGPRLTVWVKGDEPQILWQAGVRAATRLLRPLPVEFAEVAPALARNLSSELQAARPHCVAMPKSAGQASGNSLATRLDLPEVTLTQLYSIKEGLEDFWIGTRRDLVPGAVRPSKGSQP